MGRVMVAGAWLGARHPRDQYLAGSQFFRDLRGISTLRYRDVVRSYGPRSYLYAEMVFGNTGTVREILRTIPQENIYATRVTRPISLSEVVRATGLSEDEVRRFNPALVQRVPAGADLYLPHRMPEFGEDMTFWATPPEASYTRILHAFLDMPYHTMGEMERRRALSAFRDHFAATGTEEGRVMATMITYVIGEWYTGPRARILEQYRDDPQIRNLMAQGRRDLGGLGAPPAVWGPE